MNHQIYTGLADDDRRIARDLQAMGAFDGVETASSEGLFSATLEAIAGFVTWLRWKGEVSVYGCRVGADHARALERQALV